MLVDERKESRERALASSQFSRACGFPVRARAAPKRKERTGRWERGTFFPRTRGGGIALVRMEAA